VFHSGDRWQALRGRGDRESDLEQAVAPFAGRPRLTLRRSRERLRRLVRIPLLTLRGFCALLLRISLEHQSEDPARWLVDPPILPVRVETVTAEVEQGFVTCRAYVD
jgi:hypothetical protein